MAFDKIIVEISDYIATITLNRPDAMNALNSELLGELCTALEEADASDKVRCEQEREVDLGVLGGETSFLGGVMGRAALTGQPPFAGSIGKQKSPWPWLPQGISVRSHSDFSDFLGTPSQA